MLGGDERDLGHDKGLAGDLLAELFLPQILQEYVVAESSESRVPVLEVRVGCAEHTLVEKLVLTKDQQLLPSVEWGASQDNLVLYTIPLLQPVDMFGLLRGGVADLVAFVYYDKCSGIHV